MAKRITLATFKAFVKNNRKALVINVRSTFDGMVDCVMPTGDDTFSPALPSDRPESYNLGIQGVYLVGSSRDSFRPFETDTLTGISVSNSCGSFIVAAPIN